MLARVLRVFCDLTARLTENNPQSTSSTAVKTAKHHAMCQLARSPAPLATISSRLPAQFTLITTCNQHLLIKKALEWSQSFGRLGAWVDFLELVWSFGLFVWALGNIVWTLLGIEESCLEFVGVYVKVVRSLCGALLGVVWICLEFCWLGQLGVFMGALRNDAWVLSVAGHLGLECVCGGGRRKLGVSESVQGCQNFFRRIDESARRAQTNARVLASEPSDSLLALTFLPI